MAQNDVVSVEIRFLLLRLLVEISLRITWAQKLQKVLAEVAIPPVVETQRRPGPRNIPYGILEQEWPVVLARVANHKSYRKVAKDYGVSRETIRRLVQVS